MAAPDRATAAVPVLLVTGPVGVGKTVVTGEAARLLSEAGIPHAMADLAVIGACWPPPADDRWNEVLIHANLACMWGNFRRAGARRLLLCRVLEARSLLRRVPQWYLDTAAYLFDRLEHAGVEDHVIDNDDRPVAQVAADVLHAAGWLGTRSPDHG
jgi:hypothetical protein